MQYDPILEKAETYRRDLESWVASRIGEQIPEGTLSTGDIAYSAKTVLSAALEGISYHAAIPTSDIQDKFARIISLDAYLQEVKLSIMSGE
jgi:hypothetical protein